MRFVGIDPSTNTGFVRLDSDGNVEVEKVINGVGKIDPYRMITLVDNIVKELRPDDYITIESPSNHSKGKFISQMFGIAWAIRIQLMRLGIRYIDVAPSQVKKFATGKGNAPKDQMILPLSKKWGFENRNDNIRDAYVLARIGLNLHQREQGDIFTTDGHKYEVEVVDVLYQKIQEDDF